MTKKHSKIRALLLDLDIEVGSGVWVVVMEEALASPYSGARLARYVVELVESRGL